MRGSAAPKSARTPSRMPSSSPTKVRTLRLCEGSEETSRSRTPGAPRTASAISDTALESRPAETFGTHSITVRIGDSPGGAVYNFRERGPDQRRNNGDGPGRLEG